MNRVIGFVLHSDSSSVMPVFVSLSSALSAEGIDSFVVDESSEHALIAECELVVVLGGDGTMLKAIDFVHPLSVPLIGINFGHVGFLAEADVDDVQEVVSAIVNSRWFAESRVSLSIEVIRENSMTYGTFALNDVSVEKNNNQLMASLAISVDDHPLMAWSGDGIVVSTPTGSTAYAFSAGGPVIWPTADVILAVPLSAHALFARPIVIAPDSVIEVTIANPSASLTADGRRRFDLLLGDRVRVSRNDTPITFARIHQTSFTERLVAKFQLPVSSWKERSQ